MEDNAEMNEPNKPPPFFSLKFHTSFFPALLRRRLHPKKRSYESTFAGHISLELPVLAIVSIMLGIFGFTAAFASGSMIGWICGILGLGGFVYLLTGSIRSVWGIRPSFDYFRTIIFLFFLFIGLTIGLGMGNIYRAPYGIRLISGLAGLTLGYIAGIIGGLWIQRLGWMASLLDIVALAAVAGMIVLDIILLL
jgi:hypothetical protein